MLYTLRVIRKKLHWTKLTPNWLQLQLSEMLQTGNWSKLELSETLQTGNWSKLELSEMLQTENWPKLEQSEMLRTGNWPKLEQSEMLQTGNWSEPERRRIVYACTMVCFNTWLISFKGDCRIMSIVSKMGRLYAMSFWRS